MATSLSEHFTLEEFVLSETAARRNLNNAPPPAVRERLVQTAAQMERVRAILGDKPITVTSGYRSLTVNRLIGSRDSSHHVKGYAVDFICPRFGRPLEVCRAIAASDLRFDQLIHEYGRWTHISFAPAMRRQLLTIDAAGDRSGLVEVRRG